MPSISNVALPVLIIALGVFQIMQLQRTPVKRSSGQGLTAMPLCSNAHNGNHSACSSVRVVTRSADTFGNFFEIEETASTATAGFAPDRPGSPPPHIHRTQTETFTVLEGVFMYEAAGVVHSAQAGEDVVIPPGVPHTWWVGSSETNVTVVKFRIEPAGNGELAFETLSGLSRDFNGISGVNPVQLLLWAHESGMDFTFPPASVRFLVPYVVPWLGRLMGYQATYPIYSTLAAEQTSQ
mmetsp:Transcript_867/g.1284  ORF Transcript_867/g.1284 Transcript_867/m.1284 type:complete len:238 (+) Transcript_867:144-857(+)|eukprot:CAMPEP_0119108178 /NCGR_PEP_ID=MMETSP1180-20130426/13507_1 /TAXON_ID=3052 ORGANISM="Chlamydomonas cf sp, Strain CCMP681" /NCGR_SAMPLE_ID=MMETSP1180 /ASSEMBLY_ACC=CAM_ASM_000741 /LENGTH=237 /DNA_ID=CAMNT_0007093767 /DNA_START=144 /DNA_END=857 /DNA_ORIENTATION=+